VLAFYPPRHDGKVVGGVTTGEASISERVLRSDLAEPNSVGRTPRTNLAWNMAKERYGEEETGKRLKRKPEIGTYRVRQTLGK
jgi:hypothetical protein